MPGTLFNPWSVEHLTARRRARTSLGALLASLVLAGVCAAQNVTLNEAKAHYLTEIVEHIVWPGEAKIAIFTIAVMSPDRSLRRVLEERTETIVRGRPLRFEVVSGSEALPEQYAAVFVDRRFRTLYDTLFEAQGTTLLIFDGRIDHEQQMVSIVESGDQLTISLNRENLVARGFEPSLELLEFAGTKADLANELEEMRDQLQDMLLEVANKQGQLEALNEALMAESASLESARIDLARNEGELRDNQLRLHALTDEITLARDELALARQGMAEQQSLFERKQEEIARQEQAIATQQDAIDTLERQIERGRQVLAEQEKRMAEQRKLLETRGEVIATQREYLIFAVAILALLTAIAVVLQRLNRLRKRANLELEGLNEQLYEAATIDPLSGTMRRQHFMELAERSLADARRTGRPLVALMLDIDHFKNVNDRHGHAIGDQAIAEVGDVLKRDLRESDLVGRLGGEEFALLLPGCDIKRAAKIAERLRADIASTKIGDHQPALHVTTSIGVAASSSLDPSIDRTLARADQALYQAKANGRNCVEFASAN